MAQYELLINARRAVVDDRIQQAAVTVDGGEISSVRTGSEARDIGLAGDHTINLGDDTVLMPGLVDPHVSTENVAVGTRSAAMGLPAHGAPLPELQDACEELAEHRLERLEQVRGVVEELGERASVETVTDAVYADVPAGVRRAAEHSIAAQLAHLDL